MEEKKKIYRLWKPIAFNDFWRNCDTSILDDISSSWFLRRTVLQENSADYAEFLNQLKREHAIETGVIERLYDLSKGMTETFIKEGFVKSYLSHGDTDIPKNDLMNHLKDHLEAVDFIFDVVKDERPLTVGFIKQLHQLTTRHQKYADGRDSLGNKTKITLIKGDFKKWENNPTRDDGTIIGYCPPEHTDSEMDNLVNIYNGLVDTNEHPLTIATWLHHAFTTIHPFQDGNGRVARLLTSLIFIKFGFFPFTVLREEAKVKYIDALEEADEGSPQKLVDYFGETQKRNIQKALNIREVASTSLEEVESIFVKKLENNKRDTDSDFERILEKTRARIYNYSIEVLTDFKNRIIQKINGNAELLIDSYPFTPPDKEPIWHQLKHVFDYDNYRYAEKYNYKFVEKQPTATLLFIFRISNKKSYRLVCTFHQFGFDKSVLAIGTFVKSSENSETLLSSPPHTISLDNNFEPKKKNIKIYLENALTMTLAQIASEI